MTEADQVEAAKAALAKPAPDVMEIVDKVREGSVAGRTLSQNYWELTDSEAAALIASYGRRVPRAMLEELWEYCTTDHDFSPGELSESEIVDMSKIAAEYGVKVEGGR